MTRGEPTARSACLVIAVELRSHDADFEAVAEPVTGRLAAGASDE